jgi:hypothetical protein
METSHLWVQFGVSWSFGTVSQNVGGCWSDIESFGVIWRHTFTWVSFYWSCLKWSFLQIAECVRIIASTSHTDRHRCIYDIYDLLFALRARCVSMAWQICSAAWCVPGRSAIRPSLFNINSKSKYIPLTDCGGSVELWDVEFPLCYRRSAHMPKFLLSVQRWNRFVNIRHCTLSRSLTQLSQSESHSKRCASVSPLRERCLFKLYSICPCGCFQWSVARLFCV